jgi:hypothetical protein
MQENTTTQKIYKVTYFNKENQPISIGGVMTYEDCEISCQKLNELDPEVRHFPFRLIRLVWDEMEHDPKLDIFVNDADWYDEKKDMVRIRYVNTVGENTVGCIPAWQIENLDEVIAKFNM